MPCREIPQRRALTASDPLPAQAANPLVRKYSVRFAKEGRARFLSHHDLLRFWERAVRKAELPVRYSEGFNPRPRLVFPHPLGLGISSRCEEVEIELTSAVASAEVLAKLRDATAPLVRVLELTLLPPRRQGRQAVSALYAARGWRNYPCVAAAAAALWQSAAAEVTREREDGPRRIDIRHALLEISAIQAEIRFHLRLSGDKNARAEDIVRWLTLTAGEDEKEIEIERLALVLRFA